MNSGGILSLQLDIPGTEPEQTGTFSLFNLLGQKIFEHKSSLSPGKNIYAQFLPANLNAGIYFIQVQFAEHLQRTRLIILE